MIKSVLFNSFFVKTNEGTESFFARSKTFAFLLFESNSVTEATSDFLKYLMIFSAFVPLPEAKTTIFLINLILNKLRV